VVHGTKGDMIGIRVANDEVGPKDEGKVRISDLIDVTARHTDFKRLKWSILKHLP
jgi:hypothetical protein